MALAAAMALVLMLTGAAKAQWDTAVAGAAARAFCATPEGQALKCGWAGPEEQRRTRGGSCMWCDYSSFVGEAPSSLPYTFDTVTGGWSNQGDNPKWGRPISLGCDGQVIVRAVFKTLQQPTRLDDKNCSQAGLLSTPDKPDANVVRCELSVPEGPEPESERALRSSEKKCYFCEKCIDGEGGGGCPNKLDTWYSDSYITSVQGCPKGNIGTAEASTTGGAAAAKAVIQLDPTILVSYLPNRPSWGQVTGVKATLAKFEVCNNPGCFDKEAEANKIRTALKCVDGRCGE